MEEEKSIESSESTAQQPAYLEGTFCQQHPEVGAQHQCGKCGEAMCGVCAFELGMDNVICPVCIGGSEALSSRRRSLIIWGIALNVLCLVLLFAFFAVSALAPFEGPLLIVLFTLALFVCMAAVACATSALDRRLVTPTYAKVSAWGSWAMLSIIVLLTVAGSLFS